MSQGNNAPRYYQADEQHSPEHKHSGSEEHAHFQRPHRDNHQLELGVTEVAEGRADVARQVAISGGLANSAFRAKWQMYRPEWVSALFAEMTGVIFFTVYGQMSTASYVFGSAEEMPGLGSVLQIGLAYALGITFAITVAAMSSGGHFHPAITICQVIFKGFPLRKAPLYILAQLVGGFVASLITYACNKEAMGQLELGLRAAGQSAQIFSSAGPAGIIALFPPANRSYGEMFANEFFAAFFIGLVIWACLDGQNIFVSPTVVPYTIGIAFGATIWGWISGGVALNTARDVGARFACGAIYGTECFPPQYSALAALTNIFSTLCAVSIYTFILSDSRRPPAPVALGHLVEHEREAHLHATRTHDELVEKRGEPNGLVRRLTTKQSMQ